MSLLYLISISLYLLPPAIAAGLKLYGSKLYLATKSSIFVFALVYGLIIYYAFITENYLEYQLNQFDLDGNGIFSGDELTEAQGEAMSKVVSDTGRTFAPFTGLFFASAVALVYFVGFKLIAYVKKHT